MRFRKAPPIAARQLVRTTEVGAGDGTAGLAGGDSARTAGIRHRGKPRPVWDSYSWYRLEITNRSITDDAKREAIRAHLIWLASKIDDDALDHQLITLKYELMAATNNGLEDDLKGRAHGLQANRPAHRLARS